MTNVLITDNIDSLLAYPLPDVPGLWCVTFRSHNPGMYHQLYANGALVAWTDTTDQRAFLVEAADCPTELTITAVDPAKRTEDLSDHLPISLRRPGWVYRSWILRSVSYPRGSRLEVFDDHATGELDAEPITSMPAWPESLPRFAWGQDVFGRGALGYDGFLAPGLGKGAFGAGMFGFGVDLISTSIPLPEEGMHRIVFRVTTPDGTQVETQLENIRSAPPPLPPDAFYVSNYEPQTGLLTLHIE